MTLRGLRDQGHVQGKGTTRCTTGAVPTAGGRTSDTSRTGRGAERTLPCCRGFACSPSHPGAWGLGGSASGPQSCPPCRVPAPRELQQRAWGARGQSGPWGNRPVSRREGLRPAQVATVVPAAPGHPRGQDWLLPLDSSQRGYWQSLGTWACRGGVGRGLGTEKGPASASGRRDLVPVTGSTVPARRPGVRRGLRHAQLVAVRRRGTWSRTEICSSSARAVEWMSQV